MIYILYIKYLFLSQKLENTQLTSLEVLDVSRNNIGNISPGTFTSLHKLKVLNLAVNMLRTVSGKINIRIVQYIIISCFRSKMTLLKAYQILNRCLSKTITFC